jgi:hypothetical protein
MKFQFSNIEELFTKDETDPNSQRTKEGFFEFIIYSEPVEAWQIATLGASTQSPTFNFFSNHFFKVITYFYYHTKNYLREYFYREKLSNKIQFSFLLSELRIFSSFQRRTS